MYVSFFSAERYDPLTSTWTSIAAMSTRRRYVRVATLGADFPSDTTLVFWCFWGNYQRYLSANICFSGCSLCLLIARWQPVRSWRLWQLLASRNGGKIWPAGKQARRLRNRCVHLSPAFLVTQFLPVSCFQREGQHLDGHRQHAESPQQRRGGRVGRHALRRRGQRRHQLPQLGGAVQPQDQHLGGRRPHEYSQVGLFGFDKRPRYRRAEFDRARHTLLFKHTYEVSHFFQN